MARTPRRYKNADKGKPGSEAEYNNKAATKKRRAQRNKARRDAVKSGRITKGSSQEVHHVGAKRTGSLPSKTKVVSKKTNRRLQPKRS